MVHKAPSPSFPPTVGGPPLFFFPIVFRAVLEGGFSRDVVACLLPSLVSYPGPAPPEPLLPSLPSVGLYSPWFKLPACGSVAALSFFWLLWPTPSVPVPLPPFSGKVDLYRFQLVLLFTSCTPPSPSLATGRCRPLLMRTRTCPLNSPSFRKEVYFRAAV